MGKATLFQASHILKLIVDQDLSREELQAIYDSGIFTDIFEAVKLGKPIDREAVRRDLGLDKITQPKANILEPVRIIIVPAIADKFIAEHSFIVNTEEKTKVKISYLGNNFKSWFLGKVEESTEELTICCSKLLIPANDGEIISELGGKEGVATKLTHFFYLLSQQPNGEVGPLPTSGACWVIFYILDKDGALRAVCAGWAGPGWYVVARSVEALSRWGGSYDVFSPAILVP